MSGMPAAPVTTPGRWVTKQEFTGLKSFGCFQCASRKCKNTWVSAHAYPNYRQGCKRCGGNAWVYPKYLWVNSTQRVCEQEESVKVVKPHRSDLCQACHRGVCTAVGFN